MNKTSYKGFKIGDRVSVKQDDVAYDDAPPITPNMIGTIKSFPPKVTKCVGPLMDRGDYFAYIVFDGTYAKTSHSETKIYTFRAGIDICNLRKVKIVTKEKQIRKLVSNAIDESVKVMKGKLLDRVFKSGCIDVSSWDPKDHPMFLPKSILIALFLHEIERGQKALSVYGQAHTRGDIGFTHILNYPW